MIESLRFEVQQVSDVPIYGNVCYSLHFEQWMSPMALSNTKAVSDLPWFRGQEVLLL